MKEQMGGGLSRRDFVKASAVSSFAILAARSGVAQNNSDTLRVGLIGCGGRGSGAAVNHLTGNDNVKLVALADVTADRVTGAKDRLKAHPDPKVSSKVELNDDMCFVGLDAYEKLLATDVDIIIHATPPYARPQHIEAAVNAGKHVFTEKPVAVDPVGVRQFIAAANKAKEKKLSFVTGLQRRHQAKYVEAMDRIHNGEIGEILAGRAYWCGSLPFAHDRNPDENDLAYRLRNWYNQCWTCGDNIVEQHIHNLDIINWALKSHPVSVFASGGRTWKPAIEKYGDIWDSFSCDYEYPNGVHVISMSRHWVDSASGVFEEVTGVKGKINFDTLEEKGIDPYVQEHINLMASIRGTGPYVNQGVETAESTLTAIMGRMSAYTGKALTWDEAMNSDLSIVPADLSYDKEYPVGPIPVPGSDGKKA